MKSSDPDDERFEPRARDAMARMFDGVSPRYELLNRILSLGQDRAWRSAMWLSVPERARVVLDLCTGDGSSLPGLRRAGRLVVGVDASLGMLEHADDRYGSAGWAPRLVCADAFALPLRPGSVDAVTIAFGVRNLRPQSQALVEIARVMRPGGTLAVLDATAPRRGAMAPFHAFYLRRVVPLLGRLSPDPSAYEYLGRSILEFGPGEAFVAATEAAGFRWSERRSFLLGATRLWVARLEARAGENPTTTAPIVQGARLGESARGEMPSATDPRAAERRVWTVVQLFLSASLVLALAWALSMMLNPRIDIPLDPVRRLGLMVLTVGGLVAFALRTVLLLLRLRQPRQRS